jgi:hypothetical protein
MMTPVGHPPSSNQQGFRRQSKPGEMSDIPTSTTLTSISDLHGVTLQSVSAHQKALEHHSRLFTVSGNQGSTRIEDMTTLLRKTLLLVGNLPYELRDKPPDMYIHESARILLSSIF